MARYAMSDGYPSIISRSGVHWVKNERGQYEAEVIDIRCELEKRLRSKVEPYDTGWYLYSNGVEGGDFFGEWCSRKIIDAVEEAEKMIHAYRSE